ncbi:hypothetical protein SAMN02800692_2081 [Luteibacter sp. UNC138MFCol5.1]|uniref:hypothetical protein n=1 Tax=Luteibacter sp. UNC138MFCol5.1 TaxID=1502774 RepID=UPI0008B90E09|nr:hypothetical protein [Luteibacter sp. UNC138MFCol5.1]SEO77725.1 hypothetical protein SAMN02800692_2081 [Luteibacter sp. UNC138MFCol5.1]
MESPNYIALAASFAIAASALVGFHSTSTTAAPLTEINGAKVTDLAPIVVYADAGADVASL